MHQKSTSPRIFPAACCRQPGGAVLGLLLLALAWPQTAPAATTLKSDLRGLVVTCGDLPVIAGDSLLLMDENWKTVVNLRQTRGQQTKPGPESSRSEWVQPQGSLVRSASLAADGAAEVEWEFAFAPGLAAKNLELTLNLPRGAYDLIPAVAGKSHDRLGPFTQPFELPHLAGKLILDPQGSDQPWHFDDLRSVDWSGEFRLRVFLPYDPAQGVKGRAKLKLRLAPQINPAFVPVELGETATRPFIDETAGDGQGGWTDQGPNDLRSLPSGVLVASGVPLAISGRAAVLKSQNTAAFPQTTGVLPITPATPFSTLYLFHTAAWSAKFDSPVAVYRLHYADGGQTDVPVKYGRDIIDWWAARAPTSAKLAWVGHNGAAEVGISLFKIENPRPDQPLAGLEMISTQTTCAPALIAATLLKPGVLTPAAAEILAQAYVIRRQPPVDTSDWFKCPIAWRGPIAPGSALDFSFLNSAPAGQFGFLKRDGESFVFAQKPGEKIRFWGSNSAIQGPFPEKEVAPDIAKCLAAQGVNLVRLHLYASNEKLLVNSEGELDPTRLDQMEFYISELEKNGIYVFMDLDDGIPCDALLKRAPRHQAAAGQKVNFKFIATFDPELRQASKLLAQKLFTHVNPYTGKALVDDPGVAMYEIMNECSMFIHWGGDKPMAERVPEPYLSTLQARWDAWLKAENLPARPLPNHFNLDPIGRKFALQVQTEYLNDMAAHLRQLGVKAPLSGTNITFAVGDLQAAERLDYLGEHAYWAHPDCNARPITYPNSAALTKPVTALPIISDLAKGARRGWPLVIGEWNFCFPNDRRSEGIPYTAAYSAYQDWDGLIFYCSTGSFDGGNWARFTDNPGILVHSQQTDPATWGLSQIGAALFRRGDVKPAGREIDIALTAEDVAENRQPAQRLPFLSALGKYTLSFAPAGATADWWSELLRSPADSKELYAQALAHLQDQESNAQRTVSDTKELRRYTEPALLFIDTPRTQSVCGRLCDLGEVGDNLRDVRLQTELRWGSLAVTAIDGQELPASRRLLVAMVGNARNQTTKCDGETGILNDMGKAPVLAEPFAAELAVRHPGAKLKAFALDSLTGERRQELAVTVQDDFQIIQIDRSASTIYFELAAE